MILNVACVIIDFIQDCINFYCFKNGKYEVLCECDECLIILLVSKMSLVITTQGWIFLKKKSL